MPSPDYYDPGLWDALAQRVSQEVATRRDWICEGRWKTLEEAREDIGFIRGLAWVLQEAENLQTTAHE